MDPRWTRFWRGVGAIALAAHGISHAVGVELLWKVDQPGLLRYRDAVPTPGTIGGDLVGALWLAAMVLFLISAVAVLRGRAWQLWAIAGVVVSVPNLAVNPELGWAGVIADGLVFVAAVVSLLRARRPHPTVQQVEPVQSVRSVQPRPPVPSDWSDPT